MKQFISFFSGLHLHLLSALVTCLILQVGCGPSGPPMGAVSGKVFLYGQPYPNALVTFQPVEGGPAGTGRTNENGEYQIWSSGQKGAVVGSHKVMVTTIVEPPPPVKENSQMSSSDPEYMNQLLGSGSSAKEAKGPPKEKIPAKYNTQTELTFEIKSGSNSIDLDLK